ncbi:MAG: gamma-glutamylcyclotransferase [Undibacterium sp.]|nr:gamma-glutamylcyclotransferase [Opitutaceae bacterium]
MTTLFVYGTLKRGGSNQAFLAGQRFLGEARTSPGFTLFSLGAYPGLVPSPDDRVGVTGELWSIDEACLAHLDELEGTAEGLYHRASIPLAEPAPVTADTPVETYFYLRPLVGRPCIGSIWPI